jgi:hypothetical protein
MGLSLLLLSLSCFLSSLQGNTPGRDLAESLLRDLLGFSDNALGR